MFRRRGGILANRVRAGNHAPIDPVANGLGFAEIAEAPSQTVTVKRVTSNRFHRMGPLQRFLVAAGLARLYGHRATHHIEPLS